MAADFRSPDELTGLTVYDVAGDKIGGVEQVYLDDQSGTPEWATVKTGLFGTKETFVPLEGARREGDALHIPHAKELVKGAPRLEAEQHLDLAQEQELYEHYGLSRPGRPSGAPGVGDRRPSRPMHGKAADTAGTRDATSGMEETGMRGGRTTGTGGMYGGAAGTGTAAGSGAAVGAGTPVGAGAGTRGTQDLTGKAAIQEELIRSEEQLRVGTEEHESGRAHLRKVVVTENVTTTVPVSHEEVHLVREPIKDGDRTAAERARIGEAETEVVLHAEEPVIRKEAVAVERVHMETQKVTEQQEVSADLRKEQIEYDDGRREQLRDRKKGPGPGR
ncbi:PRC and DUF2382 domain-containing protein [Streptomyces sp. NPDC051322]|uniref:PRC and DUF2382 domain-containing protein n=1 Tax=Streptomyces sp. NPDC051322 TaxID=3154645 RepID=UPI003450584D